MPPESAPTDAITVETFRYPSIGGTALAFVAFFVTAGGVGFAVQVSGRELSTVRDFFVASEPGEVLGVVAALAVAGWPLRRLVRQLAIPRAVLPSIVGLYCGGMLLNVGIMLLDTTEDPAPPVFEEVLRVLTTASDPIAIGLVFLSLVVVGPVVEELLMRGILLRSLAVRWGPTVGILVSAVMFALLHGNRGQIMYALAPGIVFAVVVLRTGSLGVSIVLHALLNLTVFAILLSVGLGAVDPNAPLPSRNFVLAIIAVLAGAVLLVAGVRRLPVDVPRLAFLWGVPGEGAASARELCRIVRAIRPPPAVEVAAPVAIAARSPSMAPVPIRDVPGHQWCRTCGERMNLDVETCWFCGAPLVMAE